MRYTVITAEYAARLDASRMEAIVEPLAMFWTDTTTPRTERPVRFVGFGGGRDSWTYRSPA